MTEDRRTRLLVIAAACALALVVALSGCGSKSGKPTGGKGTALGGLTAAESALATSAPDAKLLVVQTAQPVEPSGKPVWAYLFGSPSKDKTFVVYVGDGNLMGSQEYGPAGLTEDQWAAVANPADMEVDSNEAYDSALKASGAKGDPKAYMMGFVTYVPEGESTGLKPLVWSVAFDAGESGATTATISVDGKSGKASVPK